MAIGDGPIGSHPIGGSFGDAFGEAFSHPPAEMHDQVVQRIAALEAAFERLGELQGLIGHNLPPDERADTPIAPQELAEIREALAALKAQDPTPAERPSQAVAAVATLQSGTKKVENYLAAKGDLLVTEFIKSAGAELGKRVVQAAYWGVILALMGSVVSSATEWLHSLPAP